MIFDTFFKKTSGNWVELESANGSRVVDALPPPPPIIPPILEPVWVKTKVVEKKNLRVPMARLGFGSKNQKIPLLTNHFKVNVANLQGYFYQYSVCVHTTHTTVMFISSVVWFSMMYNQCDYLWSWTSGALLLWWASCWKERGWKKSRQGSRYLPLRAWCKELAYDEELFLAR